MYHVSFGDKQSSKKIIIGFAILQQAKGVEKLLPSIEIFRFILEILRQSILIVSNESALQNNTTDITVQFLSNIDLDT